MVRIIASLLLAGPLSLGVGVAAAQEKAPTPSSSPVVVADFAGRTLTPAPPFDQGFVLRISSKKTCAFRVAVGPARPNEGAGSSFERISTTATALRGPDGFCENDIASVLIGPLQPGRPYLFRAYFVAKDKAEPHLRCLEQHWTDPENCQQPASIDSLDLLATATAPWGARFDADLGVLWAPRPGPALVGVATMMHIYAVPVSKGEELENADGFRDQVLKRVSVVLGLSAIQLTSGSPVESRTRAGNLLMGLGARARSVRAPWLNGFRLTGGLLFYSQDDPNPLVTEKIDKIAPFLAISGNLEIQAVLAPITGLLGGKP